MSKINIIWLAIILLVLSDTPAVARHKVALIKEYDFKTFYRIAKSPIMKLSAKDAWKQKVPEVKEVAIKSTADGTMQPALFYNSGSSKKKPLLVALHSWSENYYQQYSIPYGMWAVENDWVMIHPDYRGKFINPNATASELAVQDVLDAVAYARKQANVDESRIYLTGFSGGGMMTLIMVGRFPEMWTAAVAWVPVYDLIMWYESTISSEHDYSRHIKNSCGGVPVMGSKAGDECKKRSVSSYLFNAQGKRVKVLIATGAGDLFVPPGHALMAYNDLADEKDYIPQGDINYINKYRRMPKHMRKPFRDPLFTDAGMKLLYRKTSTNVVLNIYDGNHDVIYNAGLVWLNKHRRTEFEPVTDRTYENNSANKINKKK